jgi:hypothetical protein
MVEGSIGEEYRGESPFHCTISKVGTVLSPTPKTETYIIELLIYLLCLTNKVSIQRFPQGQFIVTIPRALALALDIEDRAEWKLSDGDLVLKLLK